MEFHPTLLDSHIYTLGTCNQDGAVFLWFLRLAKDALGIDYALKRLRKYSFFSLRKYKAAYYNCIRLTGTWEKGTMVLVPNDGSNVRVISFSCEPSQDPAPIPALRASDPVPQIEAPKKQNGGASNLGIPKPSVENKAREQQMQTPTLMGQTAFAQLSGVKAGAVVGVSALSGAAALAAAADAEGEDTNGDDDHPLDDNSGAPSPVRDTLNQTFSLSRRAENQGQEVDDDIAEAAARGAGIAEEGAKVTEAEYLAESVVEPVDGQEDENMYEAEGEYEEEYMENVDYEDAENGALDDGGEYVETVKYAAEKHATAASSTTVPQNGAR